MVWLLSISLLTCVVIPSQAATPATSDPQTPPTTTVDQMSPQTTTMNQNAPLSSTTGHDVQSRSLTELKNQAPDVKARASLVEAITPLSQKSVAKIYYPYPKGAMAVDLFLNNQQILKGHVAEIGGVIYVPVQRFADFFGDFSTTYEQRTESVIIKGKNLLISVRVGDKYITVNDRIFYTGHQVLSLGGWIFVPISSMSKAVNAQIYIKKGYYEAYVTSGNSSTIPWASSYYNQTDLYWLSRIISAEAKGEPLSGQIAVGNVVLNRVKSTSFPNTVKDVIFDNKYGTQFSPTANGTIYNTPTSSAVMAAKICLEGYSLSDKALYFFNPSIATSSWISRTRPYIMTIGNHKFYG